VRLGRADRFAALGLIAVGLIALTIGCFMPTQIPPPGQIPYQPPIDASQLFQPPSVDRSQQPDPVGGFPWEPPVTAHAWKYIVLHHTASTSGSVASINDAHLRRTDADGTPWRGIGYHFVIGNGDGMPDGAIETTFRWDEQSAGAHAGVGEFNANGIGVCLVGNFEEAPPTAAQLSAARRLVGALKARFSISASDVIRHGDIKATECPGRYFPHDDIANTAPSRGGTAGF